MSNNKLSKVFKLALLRILEIARLLIWYSGLFAIYSKWNTRANIDSKLLPRSVRNQYKNHIDIKSPTFILWVIGIYTAVFGIASGRYESRLDTIENRVSATITQLANNTARQQSFFMVAQAQSMRIYRKPEFWYFWVTFDSLFSTIDENPLPSQYSDKKWLDYYSLSGMPSIESESYKEAVSGKNVCNKKRLNRINYDCIDWSRLYKEHNLEPSSINLLKDIVGAYKDSIIEELSLGEVLKFERFSRSNRDLLSGCSGLRKNEQGKYVWVQDLSSQGELCNKVIEENINVIVQRNGLIGIKLRNAHLEGINLRGGDFMGANLRDIHFEGSQLGGADFQNAYMRSVYFQGARLMNCNFSGSYLLYADFTDTKLNNTNFSFADLRGVSFSKADISNAQFYGSIIQDYKIFDGVENLEYACFDDGVKEKIASEIEYELDNAKLAEGTKKCGLKKRAK